MDGACVLLHTVRDASCALGSSQNSRSGVGVACSQQEQEHSAIGANLSHRNMPHTDMLTPQASGHEPAHKPGPCLLYNVNVDIIHSSFVAPWGRSAMGT
jgi:hypothetical protein